MGIAIYNSVILDLHLPTACYKKLLGIQPDLEDLRQIQPQIAESLDYILSYEGEDLEEKLYQPFTVEFDIFGENKVYELIDGGCDMFVN